MASREYLWMSKIMLHTPNGRTSLQSVVPVFGCLSRISSEVPAKYRRPVRQMLPSKILNFKKIVYLQVGEQNSAVFCCFPAPSSE